MSREAIDEVGGTNHEPTSRRITVEAEAAATEKLKYNIPVSGTQTDNCSFLIEYYLPGSTSMLPQENISLISVFDV